MITSTFGDGGPPDNGAELLGSARLARTRPRWAVSATRCSASATGRTTTSAATPSRSTPGSRHWARRGCSTAPNARPTTSEPMRRWADRVAALLGGRAATTTGPATVAEPFTRDASRRGAAVPKHRADRTIVAKRGAPVRVRHLRSTTSAMRQATRSACSPTNDPAVVDAWLAATGLRGESRRRGRRHRADPSRRVDVASTTSAASPLTCVRFVADNSRDAKALRAPRHKLDKWLTGRNGLDLVQEFVVHADPVRSGKRSWCG